MFKQPKWQLSCCLMEEATSTTEQKKRKKKTKTTCIFMDWIHPKYYEYDVPLKTVNYSRKFGVMQWCIKTSYKKLKQKILFGWPVVTGEIAKEQGFTPTKPSDTDSSFFFFLQCNTMTIYLSLYNWYMICGRR